jgi:carotenoid 1,2-hydratase
VIGFVGSVFSPYYAAARRRGPADPLDHCAVNVALYGERGGRWAMTERGRSRVARSADALVVGPSELRACGAGLEIRLDEISVPWLRRIRGRIHVAAEVRCARDFALDPAGEHRWWPIAPSARVVVRLEEPVWQWSGTGYFDSNWGAAPLEDSFCDWTWSRAHLPDRTVVLYDCRPLEAPPSGLALAIGPDGGVEPLPPPPPAALPRSGWRIERATRADPGRGAYLRRRLEDGPFYSRAVIETHLLGTPAFAIHECLSLARFRRRWVQALLPFRMPRAPG